MQEYETKEQIFSPGCYYRVYPKTKVGEINTVCWNWLIRITKTTGHTFIDKGKGYKTFAAAEDAMLVALDGLEPMSYFYRRYEQTAKQRYYRVCINKFLSYKQPIGSWFKRFHFWFKFVRCHIFHSRYHFCFLPEYDPPYEARGRDGVHRTYCNKYCRKCWCGWEEPVIKNRWII